ncbi:hypothetical protein [Vibrio vulnificus YJ016]|uniref:Uncharacterized protein n=1 Tax=Vibrio vulnificus (strain YJ016) TaxID=196600 RepID=Q7MEJ3_VIBVY|nr:hypothetical protein [Vibrio vulnificus YJ016]
MNEFKERQQDCWRFFRLPFQRHAIFYPSYLSFQLGSGEFIDF